MLKIVTAPNPILSGISKPVKKVDKSISKLLKEMEESLLSATDPEGVGLAAPQIGKPLRIFITKPAPNSPIKVFINPEIKETGKKNGQITLKNVKSNITKSRKTSKKKDTKLEGCLSLPNIWGEVYRDPKITISYLDQLGKHHTKTFKDLLAIIVQHEIDHLNGILFPKRVFEQKGTLYKSHRNEKGEDIFEEIEL